jgi:hypothetical protein
MKTARNGMVVGIRENLHPLSEPGVFTRTLEGYDQLSDYSSFDLFLIWLQLI